MPFHFTSEDVVLFIGLIGSVLGIYGRFKGEIIAQEQRLVKLEKDNQYLLDFKQTAIRRLDDHDKQNQSLLVMAEKINQLSDDIKELKENVKKMTKA